MKIVHIILIKGYIVVAFCSVNIGRRSGSWLVAAIEVRTRHFALVDEGEQLLYLAFSDRKYVLAGNLVALAWWSKAPL